ncbi:YfhE family protein [Ferdinandcohnia quinoae]|uniref:YfhE family protein n=1 Tax=Fredinandcohnia quinoae TaxID=2918902 RepID=A0AAW5E4U9_9BACI|nr:YfhE family protein [Fredinandcohnia sp. SECRCQ15]MCH1627533.1 YfhE family protein [Fredinandcohnia sp. SECRCQ15]
MPKDKKREAKTKSTLSSMQEVTYSREFRMADRAGGFVDKHTKY